MVDYYFDGRWQLHFLMTREEVTLSKVMGDAFLTFGSCPGNDTCEVGGSLGSIEWPRYSKSLNGSRLEIQLPMSKFKVTVDNQYDTNCDFFDKVVQKHSKPIYTLNMPSAYDLEMASAKIQKKNYGLKFINSIFKSLNKIHTNALSKALYEIRQGTVRDDVEVQLKKMENGYYRHPTP